MSFLDVIKRSTLFYELSDDEIETIVNKSSVMELENNKIICKDGEEGTCLFIVLSGIVSIEKSGLQVATLSQGDIIGEFILLNEMTRTADVKSQGASTLLIIENQVIFNLYQTNPQIFSIIMLNLSRRLMEKVKQSGKIIQKLNEEIKNHNKQAA